MGFLGEVAMETELLRSVYISFTHMASVVAIFFLATTEGHTNYTAMVGHFQPLSKWFQSFSKKC